MVSIQEALNQISQARTQLGESRQQLQSREQEITEAEGKIGSAFFPGDLKTQLALASQPGIGVGGAGVALKKERKSLRARKQVAFGQIASARGELDPFRTQIQTREQEITSFEGEVKRAQEIQRAFESGKPLGDVSPSARAEIERIRRGRAQFKKQQAKKLRTQLVDTGVTPIFTAGDSTLTGFRSEGSQQTFQFDQQGLQGLGQTSPGSLFALEQAGFIKLESPRDDTRTLNINQTLIPAQRLGGRSRGSGINLSPIEDVSPKLFGRIPTKRNIIIDEGGVKVLGEPDVRTIFNIRITEDPQQTLDPGQSSRVATPINLQGLGSANLQAPSGDLPGAISALTPKQLPPEFIPKGGADIQDVQEQGIRQGQQTLGDISQRLQKERVRSLVADFRALTPKEAEVKALAGEPGFIGQSTPTGSLISFDTSQFAGDVKGAGSLSNIRKEVGNLEFAKASARSGFIGAGKFGLGATEFFVEDVILGATSRTGTAKDFKIGGSGGVDVSFFDKGIFKKAKETPSDPIQFGTQLGLTIGLAGPSLFKGAKTLRTSGVGAAAGEVAFGFSPIKPRPGVFTPDVSTELIKGKAIDIGIEGQPSLQAFSGRGVGIPEVKVTSVGRTAPSGRLTSSITQVERPFIELTPSGKVNQGVFLDTVPSFQQPSSSVFNTDTRLGSNVIANLEARNIRVTQLTGRENIISGEKVIFGVDTKSGLQEQFIFGSNLVPEITTTKSPLIQRGRRIGLDDLGIDTRVTPPRDADAVAQVFGGGSRVRFRFPEPEVSDVGTTIIGGGGRRTPFQTQQTTTNFGDVSAGISSALKTSSKNIGSSITQAPQIGFPTIVGGAGARGAFTGTGQFERPEQAFFRPSIVSPRSDLSVGGVGTTGFGFGTIFETPTRIRDRQGGIGIITNLGRGITRPAQEGRFAVLPRTLTSTTTSFRLGQLLETQQRQRQRATGGETTQDRVARESFFVPTTGGFRPPKDFFSPPFKTLGGFGGRPRRRKGRRRTAPRIAPSFTASSLNLIGSLPKSVVIGGVDLGILPGKIRKIPRRKKSKKKKK